MTTPTLTCEHCESEIDATADPRCIQQGGMDVMCESCREVAYQRYGIGPCILNDLPIVKAENERARRRNIENEQQDWIKRGFQ